MFAARIGQVEVVRDLIKHGADINAKNNDGNNHKKLCDL